jgi:hypothetical protein
MELNQQVAFLERKGFAGLCDSMNASMTLSMLRRNENQG